MNQRNLIKQTWKELRFISGYPKTTISRATMIKNLQVTDNTEVISNIMKYEKKHNCIVLGYINNQTDEMMVELPNREIVFVRYCEILFEFKKEK